MAASPSDLGRPLRRFAQSLLPGLALALALCGGVLAGEPETRMSTSLPAPGAVRAVSPEADYRIGPLDVLDISDPAVPEMTSTVRVSGNGEISLPLVGLMSVNGKTAMELQGVLAERLKRFVKNPQVSVFVKEYASQRVTVEGEVMQPGIYPIEGKTTLLQALALAHGISPNAKLNGIAIFRTVNGQRMAAMFDLKAVRQGKQPDPEVFGNDLVEVNTSASKQFFHNLMTAMPLATFIPRP